MAFALTGIRLPTVRTSRLSARSGFQGEQGRRAADLAFLPRMPIKVPFLGELFLLLFWCCLNSLSNRPNFAINDLIYKSFEYKVEPDAGQLSTAFELIGAESTSEGYKGSNSSHAKERVEDVEEKPRCVPPPGSGRRIYEIDPLLVGHRSHLDYR
ncbi:hypothetical protein BHM03_00015434 [Ensete ventricosum]|nr:hypothetical protein BHM03_00015434 [Ensete ventricosum]